MNAEGGVYWRSQPDWNTPVAIAGNGFYEGTTIAVSCYQSSTAVPGSTDTMWERASVVSGPGSGSGWINEHFIDDGAALGQPSPGIGPCQGSPPVSTPPAQPPPKPGGQVLVPDPSIWSVRVDLWRQFGTQIREADWKVEFIGLGGTPHQNGWTCRYSVVMTVPDEGGDTGPLLPITRHFPIDFAEVCAEQFPGSHLQYELGPIYSSAWPWECIGQAGKYYPPPSLTLAKLDHRRFKASGVPAGGAGKLHLKLFGPTPRGSSAGRHTPIAEGSRTVDRRGHYRISLTVAPRARHLLRNAKRLRARFSLVFHPVHGRVQHHTTTVVLHR